MQEEGSQHNRGQKEEEMSKEKVKVCSTGNATSVANRVTQQSSARRRRNSISIDTIVVRKVARQQTAGVPKAKGKEEKVMVYQR